MAVFWSDGSAPQFVVGDRVERVGGSVHGHLREGVVVCVIPDEHGLDGTARYEVDFRFQKITLTQVQLRHVNSRPAHKRKR